MAVDFAKSETRENLMRAFAGESQARNRYVFAAEKAKEQKLQVLEKIFRFTADQEQAHAQVFYNFLKEAAGTTITIDGGYPVDLDENLAVQLKRAVHNETEEFEDVYPAFADKAEEEGFAVIAHAFRQIAEIEKTHADRFARYQGLTEQGMLFKVNGESYWMCLNCGYIYKGEEVPAKCPVCQHDQGYFVRLEEAPWTTEKEK